MPCASYATHFCLALLIADALQHALCHLQLPVLAAQLLSRLFELVSELCKLCLSLLMLASQHLVWGDATERGRLLSLYGTAC